MPVSYLIVVPFFHHFSPFIKNSSDVSSQFICKRIEGNKVWNETISSLLATTIVTARRMSNNKKVLFVRKGAVHVLYTQLVHFLAILYINQQINMKWPNSKFYGKCEQMRGQSNFQNQNLNTTLGDSMDRLATLHTIKQIRIIAKQL